MKEVLLGVGAAILVIVVIIGLVAVWEAGGEAIKDARFLRQARQYNEAVLRNQKAQQVAPKAP